MYTSLDVSEVVIRNGMEYLLITRDVSNRFSVSANEEYVTDDY